MGKPVNVRTTAAKAASAERKYYGVHACQAVWEQRREDIVKVYLLQSLLKTFGPLLSWCAKAKRAYKIVEVQDLDKLTKSVHHEGVCLIARAPSKVIFPEIRDELIARDGCALYLDGVSNPHNFGSIMRVCAHFGVKYVMGMEGELPSASGSVGRVAQGAAEAVTRVPLPKPAFALTTLQKSGYKIVAAEVKRGTSLFRYRFSPKTIICLGAEQYGVSGSIRALADSSVFIPGTGNVDSLNVAAACSIMLAEYWRQMEQKRA